MDRRHPYMLALLAAIVATGVSKPLAQEAPPELLAKPLGWIGLYDPGMAVALYEMQGAGVSEPVGPITFIVRAEPSHDAEAIGAIHVVATLEEGFRAEFERASDAKRVPFQPDLFDPDYGYGPFFHQTVLEQQDTWFKLPKNPLPQEGWIDVAEFSQPPAMLPVTTQTIYTLGDASIIILDSGDDGVTMREEQEADYCCCEDPPPLQPFEIREVRYDELFDVNGHLRLKIKYTRGC